MSRKGVQADPDLDAATLRRANLHGSLWMIAAMALFAAEDAFIKVAAKSIPVGQILIIFGLGGALVFAGVALVHKEPLFNANVVSRPMRIRAVFEITGRLFYVLAIAAIPLSAVTVILQATPIVVVTGAALIFGERVGWRRWLAIFTGLAGVIVIIQPGTESFSALSLLAVIGMIGFAGRDLASRAAPRALSTTLLGLYGFLSIVVAGMLYSLWQMAPIVWPSAPVCLALLGTIVAGVVAYSCLMKAMRTGEVSAVTPFRYTRILFGIGLGVALFGETLSGAMIAGSCLIVLSGLFILRRGQQVKRSTNVPR
ncbi:DMT family transporter [Octadecabacter sp. R77987]|uniref:DMT family transporter n=1 Tax=Octadecabacter sp. R77987 TaxID=3093874 RepID=UPI00367165E5